MSPRTLAANQLLRDERQDQILHAALAVFARQGYAAAKISDIAALARVSYGLIDHYYGKKEDIFIAVMKHAFEGILALLEEVSQLPGSPWDRLEALCAQELAGIQRAPEYVLLVNQASSIEAIPAETKTLFNVYRRRSTELQAEMIRQGQAAGQVIGGDPEKLVILFAAIIQGLAMEWFDEDHRGAVQAHFPDVDTVLRFLRP